VPLKRLPSVVLVGRPNVGKSTLFNRLTGTRRAIVTATPGTTRDVLTHPVVWQDLGLELTDTGGMFGASEDPLHQLVFERGQRALATADVIVFIVDGREGLVPGDENIAAAVRSANVPVILVVNKIDDRRARAGALELYRLGFDPILEVSAEHGQGVGELLDEIVKRLPHTVRLRSRDADDDEEHEESGGSADTNGARTTETAVAIVGRPNAGKSSLVNRLLREERMIVSEMPGTTRDPVDSVMKWHRRQFRIVDTAGIRRPGRVAQSGQMEVLSVMLARRAIERADVVILVLDATAGATDQDAAIAGAADKAGRGVIIAANKWDLMKEQGPDAYKAFDQQVRFQLKFLEYAPIVHISAKSGERTPKLLEMVDKVAAARRVRVSTPELNRFVEQITHAHPPVSPGHRNVRVLYAAQTGIAPPTFVLFTNVATRFHFSYERFLQNQLRETYGFIGTPLKLTVRKRSRRPAQERKP
jgi:GTP-binding protein